MMDVNTLLTEAKQDGVITADQYNQLQQRAGNASPLKPETSVSSDNPEGTERFQFVSSLSDWFIAAGIVFFFVSFYALLPSDQAQPLDQAIPTTSIIFLIVAWLMSEYVAGRRRLTLPSMALLYFVSLPVIDIIALLPSFHTSIDHSVTSTFAGIGLASALFFARFRLPFALLPLAFSIIYLIMFGYIYITQNQNYYIFDPSYYTLDVIIILCLLGIGTFAAAMMFDMKDPLRLGSDSARAFWLHLVASPILIQVVAINLIAKGSEGLFVLIPYLIFYTLVALLIDRRAGVLSAIVYLGFSLSYIANFDNGGIDVSFMSTALIPSFLSAAVILVVSLFWSTLRTPLVKAVLSEKWQKRLPPIAS